MKEFKFDGFQIIHPTTCGILKERRIFLGMTQKQVAEKAGIPIQSYQRFESGERNIMTASFQMACRVIETLEMDISAFFHNEYVLGEPTYDSPEGLRFKKTGKLINEDIVEESDK